MERFAPLLFIGFIAVGIAQFVLGYMGIEYHFGMWAALAAVAVGVFLRIVLPLSIGSYFGAVDVMGWEWYVGVLIAAPGLLFIVPSMVASALDLRKRT